MASKKLSFVCFFTFCLIKICFCDTQWGYKSGLDGPEQWKEHNEQCGGQKQSPVAIWPKDLVLAHSSDNDLIRLKNYSNPIEYAFFENNGHTVQINIPQGINIEMCVEFLAHTEYRLKQLHFHWSLDDSGSEHTIGNTHYPLEVDTKNVLNSTSGIAVLGLFVEIDDNSANEPMEIISNHLTKIWHKGDTVVLSQPLNLSAMLPQTTDKLIHYFGSLTTPPCSEVVNWLILTEPTKITTQQLRRFQKFLYDLESDKKDSSDREDESKNEHFNFRPTQSLNGRKLHLWSSKKFLVNKSDTRRNSIGIFVIASWTLLLLMSVVL